MSDIGEWYIVLLLIISEICDSPLTLIASCLAVMALANGVIRLTNIYLNSCKSHSPPSTAVTSGITEGMVMFLLSMQTGLIDMKLPQRLGAMSIIMFIVIASLFQTVLEITHPVLLALSASSRNVWSHLKVRHDRYKPVVNSAVCCCCFCDAWLACCCCTGSAYAKKKEQQQQQQQASHTSQK